MDRTALNHYRLVVLELLPQHHISSRDPRLVDALARLFYSIDQGDIHGPHHPALEGSRERDH